MRARPLHRSDYRRMRWRNDLGWTNEVAVSPDGATLEDAFDWRLSIAEVEADAPFSPLPGIERTIVLLDGEGMRLAGPAGETMLDRRGQSHSFAGDEAIDCRLVGGACRDFNVMTRRGRATQRVWFRPLVGPMVFFQEPRVTWAIHVAGGRAAIQHAAVPVELAQGETLLLEPDDDGARRVVLAGGGELVLVRLEAR